MQASPLPTCIACSRQSKFVKRYSSRCDRTATLPVSRKRNFLGRHGVLPGPFARPPGEPGGFTRRPHPDPAALYREISRQLGHSSCDVPSDFPQSFLRAPPALNTPLNSANPQGVGLRRTGRALIGYDAAKSYELVHTLSHYLECFGSYDGSAANCTYVESTLRYRLGRIADLRSFDLRDIDTRFNLHAATRVWRFLTPDPSTVRATTYRGPSRFASKRRRSRQSSIPMTR